MPCGVAIMPNIGRQMDSDCGRDSTGDPRLQKPLTRMPAPLKLSGVVVGRRAVKEANAFEDPVCESWLKIELREQTNFC